MEEPRNPYHDTPTESEKRLGNVEFLLYCLFAARTPLKYLVAIGLLISVIYFAVCYLNL